MPLRNVYCCRPAGPVDRPTGVSLAGFNTYDAPTECCG